MGEATEAGKIALNLGIDMSSIRREIMGATDDIKNQVTSAFSGVGETIGAALGIGAVTLFGKSCIDLGSDLSEVQNVVDTAFKSMSSYVDSFARDAMENFGLSETVAKQYMGTIGAMNNAFGFTEKESLEMAKAVTGLTGDVASFYNLGSDEAFTKLKSIWTGETETLKDLGVVMTQTALDQYAINNGFGKTTAKMTEQEKVMLRFQYVTSALSDASGDFIKTQDGWANQTRVLQLQIESFKATIGQGLINLFTPVLQMLNQLAAKAGEAAAVFRDFTEAITGNKSSGGGGETAKAMQAITQSAEEATKSVENTETSLASFDKMTKLSGTDTSKSDSESGKTNPIDNKGIQNSTKSIGNLQKELSKIKQKVKDIYNLTKKGFLISFKSDGLQKIPEYIKGIGSSIKGIFTDKEVQKAISDFADTYMYNLGRSIGAAASIGTSIATMLLGGIQTYLSQNSGRIKEYIIKMLSIGEEISTIHADFMDAMADIFTIFEGPEARQIVADCIAIFNEAFFGVTELAGKIGRDILDAMTAPIVKNKGKIKKALEKTLSPISNIVDTIKEAFTDVSDILNDTYDNHIKPMFDNFKNGFSEIAGVILDNYNTHFAPVLNTLADEFKKLYDEGIHPLIEKVSAIFGGTADMISELCKNILQPAFEWIINTLSPILGNTIKVIFAEYRKVLTGTMKIVGSVLDTFKGFIKFFTGVFSGDWKKAWEGMKEVLSGSINAIKNIVKTGISVIRGRFEFLLAVIKSIFSGIGGWFKNIFSKAWEGIKGAWSGTKGFFTGIWSGIKSAFSNVTNWFENVFKSAWQGVKDVFSTGGKIFDGIKDGIADVFKTVVNGLIGGINKVISVPFNAINGMLNDIRNVGVGGVKPFKGLWDENPLDVPQIPQLAQGGYVKANTPQLAMIGDNRHQGEVVAPEDKLRELAENARSIDSAALDMILEYLQMIYEKDTTAYVNLTGGAEEIFRINQRKAREYTARTKKAAFPGPKQP